MKPQFEIPNLKICNNALIHGMEFPNAELNQELMKLSKKELLCLLIEVVESLMEKDHKEGWENGVKIGRIDQKWKDKIGHRE